jgi:hypothetical protein
MMKALIFGSLFYLSILRAQDVPPPPKFDAVDPALAPVLESFRQTLLSTGRVESSYTLGDANYRIWQRITSVVVNTGGCQARMHFDGSFNGGDPTDEATSLFFESVDKVEALTQQELEDRIRSRIGQSRFQTYSGSAVYVLAINGHDSFFRFADEARAKKAADAVRRAAQICRAAPIVVNAAAGAPSLAETLHFIEDKLNDSGAVNFRAFNQNPDGSAAGGSVSVSWRMSEATADTSTCQVGFQKALTQNGATTSEQAIVLSFRRVDKLEVATEQDAINRVRAQNGQSALIYKTEPSSYRLSISAGGNTFLNFRDEETANRIVKAMNHAVELCGGSKKPL